MISGLLSSQVGLVKHKTHFAEYFLHSQQELLQADAESGSSQDEIMVKICALRLIGWFKITHQLKQKHFFYFFCLLQQESAAAPKSNCSVSTPSDTQYDCLLLTVDCIAMKSRSSAE